MPVSAFVILAWTGGGQARTWHVPADAPTVQAGIDSAQSGDDVLLAPGTYSYTSEAASGSSMIHMKPGVWLHSAAGAEFTILDAQGMGRVMRLNEMGDTTHIEGLTLTGGVPANDFEGSGGGIYITGSGHPNVSDCVLFANRSFGPGGTRDGGGIACTSSVEPTVRRCVFLNNRAEEGAGGRGGGIACEVATIEDCEFEGNRARQGGGVLCGATTVQRCVFRANVAAGDPGGRGGAIRSTSAIITNSIFEDNSVVGFMGSLAGGAISDLGAVSISGCHFQNNQARARGGAIELAGGGRVLRCLFIDNRAVFGGAIAMGASTVTDCVFLRNTATTEGTSSTTATGGAIYATDVGTIEGSTLVDNICSIGVGAISMLAAGDVRRSIVVRTVGAICDASSGATWSCCALFDNAEGDAICGSDGGGNFIADPQFCATDPAASSNVLIQGDSPCAPGNHPQGASCGLIGAGPVGCGTVAVESRTWSQIKSMYR